jgi:RHS repeat-associated protein
MPVGAAAVEYVRGPDMGGGVGGLLYSVRGGAASMTHSSGRGDVIMRREEGGSVTWQAQYEAFGRRPEEMGVTLDRQRANSKEEDPTGLLNEGFRYRDLETGTFITRDPIGFKDGPNLYTYVKQNPWTKIDPHGLWLLPMDEKTQKIVNNVRMADKRLAQIVTELEKSPHPFEISASLSNGKGYGERGEFSPGTLKPSGKAIDDARLAKSDDRYNGKGMGGRIMTVSEASSDGKSPEATMAHELGHAFDANRGISPILTKEQKGIIGKGRIPLSKLSNDDENENRAVRTENIYNESKGLPLRKTYPVSPDNGRKIEAVPNPEAKYAPVSTEPVEGAPHLRQPITSAKTDSRNQPK